MQKVKHFPERRENCTQRASVFCLSTRAQATDLIAGHYPFPDSARLVLLWSLPVDDSIEGDVLTVVKSMAG